MAAHGNGGEYTSIREMSQHLDISFHFLTKTLQSLTQHGLLVSYRGPSGGIAFNKPPEQITLKEVVEILEGKDFFETCLLGLPGCGKEMPCPVHNFWTDTRQQMETEFERTSLATLGAKVLSGQHRLTE